MRDSCNGSIFFVRGATLRRRGGSISLAVLLGALLITTASVAAASTRHSSSSLVVAVTKNAKYGSILTEDGYTLYRYTLDKANKSNCTGSCSTYWPALTLPKGVTKPVGQGVSGLGTIVRSKGVLQVTYEGIPLYRYVGDTSAGTVNGEGADQSWYAINPASPKSIPKLLSSAATTTTASSGGYSY